jgi:hypothetical protein
MTDTDLPLELQRAQPSSQRFQVQTLPVHGIERLGLRLNPRL